ncbi:MAG TPA: hypothetical protein VHC86_10255 [Opitutaceae bacterium]|nr:hypothetical protein [Opitutaceae bacterium]
MRVKNVPTGIPRICACGSWLRHWERFSGQRTSYCAEITCYRQDLAGAVVTKASGYDASPYVLPLCAAHRGAAVELTVSDNFVLVSADPEETCGRPSARPS